MPRSLNTPVWIGVIAIAWIGAACIAPPGIADLLFRASTLIVLAISWNLMANAGLISLAHAAFSGVGGYVAVILAKLYGLPLLAVLPMSIACGALLGAFLAAATRRLSGFYFAIATLAVAEGLRVLALMVPRFTGGAQGIYVPQPLRYELASLSIGAAVLAAACLAIAYALSRSSFHYACRAMRSGEAAAQMLGLNPRRYRLGVLAISGAMASCMGALTAWYAGFLDPRIAFSLHISIMAQIAPIIGGVYLVGGSVIGALALTGISELTRLGFDANEGAGHLLYGLILVVSVLVMPQGIYGFLLGRWRKNAGRATVASSAAPRAAPEQP